MGTLKVWLMLPVLSFSWTSGLYSPSWTPPVQKNFYTDAFLQDYSYAGYHRGEAPLPTLAPREFNVTRAPFNADSSGTTDATTAIQRAIDSIGKLGGGVVYLPKGTYRLSTENTPQALRIQNSNIVLRGDGPGKTFLYNTTTAMRNKSIIKVISTGSSWNTLPAASDRIRMTQDLRGPTTAIPVTSTSSFQIGDWVILRSWITEAWISEHQESDWTGYASSFPGILYCRKILSINAVQKTLTVDVPTRYSMLMRDSAMVYKAPVMLEEVGLEMFSIGNAQINIATGWGEEDYNTEGNASYDAHNSYAINMDRVRNGWIRKVHSYQPPTNTSTAHILSNGVLLNQTRGVTIDSCEFSRGQYGGGGGNGYMYRISGNENLLRDTKATFARHGFVLSHMQASGNVFFRVHDKDGGKQTSLTGNVTTSGKGSDHHMHFSHSNLFDQCISENSNFQASYRPYGSAPKHNLTAAHSAYWNTKGLGTGVSGNSYVIISQQARYGYIIGTQGTRTTVNVSATGTVLTKTAPLDSVEGLGQGTTLTPQSLYMDQLQKRIETSTTIQLRKSKLKPEVKTRRVNLLGQVVE